jgi:acyl-CoA thioester hydrolase
MRDFQADVSVELEVPFHDVDMLHVVWHGHYLKYFEIGRTALFRKYDIDGQRLLETGHGLLVIESKCRHTFPLRFGERFRVGAAFRDVDYRLLVDFEIHNLTQDRRCAYGHTSLATVDLQGHLLLRTPDVIVRRIRG